MSYEVNRPSADLHEIGTAFGDAIEPGANPEGPPREASPEQLSAESEARAALSAPAAEFFGRDDNLADDVQFVEPQQIAKPDDIANDAADSNEDVWDLTKAIDGAAPAAPAAPEPPCACGGALAPPSADQPHRRGSGPIASAPAVAGGGSGIKPATVEQLRVLDDMALDKCECADAARPEGAPCSSKPIVDAIGEFAEVVKESGAASDRPARAAAATKAAAGEPLLPTAHTPAAAKVRAAAAVLGCTSESCVLSSPVFVKFAGKKLGITEADLEKEKQRKFKAAGPRDSTALLNNYNIDDTLRSWMRTFPEFFAFPFAMMDFLVTKEPFESIDVATLLDGTNPLGRRFECFGCVVNTDVSTGGGTHWVASFVDTRGRGDEVWSVEYFNSAGRPPPKPMIAWMEKRRARLTEVRQKDVETYGPGPVETVAVTAISHQNSQTECGLYSLFYIRRRLEGTPIEFFADKKNLISDAAMVEFRKYVFRASS